MKKLFTFAVVCLTTISTWAYNVEMDGIYYNLSSKNKTAEVTNGTNKYSGSITIPETIISDGVTYSVTGIGDKAFLWCSDLISVTIPNSVASIGFQALSGCSGMTSMIIPNSVTSIGNYAFVHCSSLESIVIPKSVTEVGVRIFTACTKLESLSVDVANEKYDSRENCNAIIETATNKLCVGYLNLFFIPTF